MANSRVPSVSIIIPVYQGGEDFRRCLESVVRMDPPSYEVIVVADGNVDQDTKLAEEFGFKHLNLPVRKGPAHARNLGAESAQGELLLFLDSDVLVPQDTLTRFIPAFMYDPELAAIFGSYDDQPADLSFLSQYRNLLHHHVHQTAHTEASTFWAGCGVIRRDVFLKLGGFDQDFGVPSVEDIELGYRLKSAGYRIQLMKSLQVKHLKHWGVLSLVTTDFFQRAIPWSRLILRNHWMINDLNLKVSSRFSVLLVYGLVASLLLIPADYKMAGLAMVMVAGLLLLNQSLHRFFLRKRGLWFAVLTVPWLWVYFFYSGLAFAFELLRHGFEVPRSLVVAKTPSSRPGSEVENRSEVR